MSGLGAGGALGGITGAIIGAGMPEYEAKRYDGRVRKGGMLLSVHCDDVADEKRTKQFLKNAGGQDISSSSEAKADDAVSTYAQPRTVTQHD